MNRLTLLASLAAVLALGAACTAPVANTGGTCGSEAFQDQIGASAADAAGAMLTSALTAPPEIVRWIRPGDAVTLDFRQERMNIALDADDIVTQIYCG